MFDFTFVLPGPGNVPVGGFKIVYEYSNRLSALGYKVSIVHSGNVKPDLNIMSIKLALSYIKHYFDKGYIPHWFDLRPEINVRWVPQLRAKYFGESRVFVATAWDTAKSVREAATSGSKGFYLIQDYEIWTGSPQEVEETYGLGLTNIAIARWLQNLVIDTGNECSYIPNALESKDFFITNPIEDRNGLNIGVLYHTRKSKNFITSLAALEIIRQKYPNMRAKVFGASKPELDLPDWVDFYFRPNKLVLREIYNSCAVFLTSSTTEGWGLTGCEAMQCGCALVASDIPGHREYAEEGKTALLFPALSPELAASRIEELINNKPLRIKLASQGNKLINEFTWEKSIRLFLGLL